VCLCTFASSSIVLLFWSTGHLLRCHLPLLPSSLSMVVANIQMVCLVGWSCCRSSLVSGPRALHAHSFSLAPPLTSISIVPDVSALRHFARRQGISWKTTWDTMWADILDETCAWQHLELHRVQAHQPITSLTLPDLLTARSCRTPTKLSNISVYQVVQQCPAPQSPACHSPCCRLVIA
jgi:hypothetical protein